MDVQYNSQSHHQPSLWFRTMNMMEPLAEMDGFEPQTRARSNTWPLPRPENYVDPPEEAGATAAAVAVASNKCVMLGGGGAGGVGTSGMDATGMGGAGGGAAGLPMPTAVIAAAAAAKKNSSRRNAWGNLSYADLITQAITSAPEKRLTLSQIYEWMVQNVPYFKDKGDSNSSAGWKNSIRHNLSLHNRFMRVQNEGTGKSSWWMINPDAKPGKSVRRRAASMETSKFEKRRGRVKKKVEALRNGLTADATPSPSSSVSEGLDLFPDSPLHSATGFQLSPDFRPRASSATSSCGRLSPIPAVLGVEPDWSSLTNFTSNNGAYDSLVSTNNGSYSPDQLAGNLEQGMKIQADAYLQGYVNGQTSQPPPPPPYSTGFDSAYGSAPHQMNDHLSSLSSPFVQCPLHRLQPCNCFSHHCEIKTMSPTSGISPSYSPSEQSPDPITNQYIMNCIARPSSNSPPLTPTPNGVQQSQQQRQQNSSPPQTQSQQQQLQQRLSPQSSQMCGGDVDGSSVDTNGVDTREGPQPVPSTMLGQLMGALNNSTLLDDLNLNIETLDGGFDCNVDEVIKHELSMEGSLDFNFSAAAAAAASAMAAAAATNPNHHLHHHNHHLPLHQQQQHHHHPHHLHSQQPQNHQQHQQQQQQHNHLNGPIIVSQEVTNAAQTIPSNYTTTVTAPSWVH